MVVAPPNGRGIFDFNTVAYNVVDSIAASSGIRCSDALSRPFVGNVIYGNTGAPQASVQCSIAHSDIEGGFPGTGNIQSDPLFFDRFLENYHLMTTSPCRNAVPSSIVGAPDLDFDGDRRPFGSGYDMGADELPL